MPSPPSLTFFEVTGNFYATADPSVSGNLNAPVVQTVNALVTFTPRLPRGQTFEVGDTVVSLSPLAAQIADGVLSTIDYSDAPGIELVSNSEALGLDELIYDVTFTQVNYNGACQYSAPFAFVAPTDSTPVDLADVTKLPWQPPSNVDYVPPHAVGQSIPVLPNWRQRALWNSA
jgi:hypothetical protein